MFRHHPILSYTIPFAAFLVLLQWVPEEPTLYPFAYTIVILIVGLVTLYCLKGRQIIQPHGRIVPGLLVGTVGILLWILLAHWQRELTFLTALPNWLQPTERVAFDPFTAIPSAWGQSLFIGIRLMGIAILVPLVEEVFWRGFLLRWLSASEWEAQPMGHFTPAAFFWVTLLFTLAHPEWLAAATWCALINLLFWWKKDLWNCIVAHSVSNALLLVYILHTGHWELW